MYRTLNETLSVAEFDGNVRSMFRTINEVLRLSESVSRIKGAIRPINETIQASEIINRFKSITLLYHHQSVCQKQVHHQEQCLE